MAMLPAMLPGMLPWRVVAMALAVAATAVAVAMAAAAAVAMAVAAATVVMTVAVAVTLLRLQQPCKSYQRATCEEKVEGADDNEAQDAGTDHMQASPRRARAHTSQFTAAAATHLCARTQTTLTIVTRNRGSKIRSRP